MKQTYASFKDYTIKIKDLCNYHASIDMKDNEDEMVQTCLAK